MERRELFALLREALVSRGHSRQVAERLLKNLVADGFMSEVASSYSKITLAERLISSLESLGRRGSDLRLSLRTGADSFFSVLDKMAGDTFYNRGYSLDRSVIVGVTTRKYREGIGEALNLLEGVTVSALRDLQAGLLDLAGPMNERASALLDSFLKEKIEPEGLMAELKRILRELDQSRSLGEKSGEEIAEMAYVLGVLESRLQRLEERAQPILEKRRGINSIIEGVRKKLTELETIAKGATKEKIHLDFLSVNVDWDILMDKVVKQCTMAGLEGYEGPLQDAKDLDEDVSHRLKSARKAMDLADGRRRLLGATDGLRKACGDLDSLLGAEFFLGASEEILDDTKSLMAERHFETSSSLDELVGRMNSLEEETKDLISLEAEMRKLIKAPAELREGLGPDGMIGVIACLVPFSKLLKSGSDRHQVLTALKEHVEEAKASRDTIQDAVKLYPIWRQRVIALVSDKGILGLKALDDVPLRWRRWVASRISREEAGISFSGERLISTELLTPAGIRLGEVKGRILKVDKVLKDLERFGVELKEEQTIVDEMWGSLSEIEDSVELLLESRGMEEAKRQLGEMDVILDAVLTNLRNRLVKAKPQR